MIDGLGFKLKEMTIFASLIIPRNKFGQYGRSFLLTNMVGVKSYSLQAAGFETTSDFAIAIKIKILVLGENPVSSGAEMTICFCKNCGFELYLKYTNYLFRVKETKAFLFDHGFR